MDTFKYEHLKRVFKENIRDGLWRPGEKIPVETALSEEYGVSKITVKKAKQDLIVEGILETLPGRRGSFVREITRSPATDFIGVAIDNMQNLFVAEMLRGIEEKLWEHGLHTILCNTNFDVEKIEAYFYSLLQRNNVAGVIFTPIKGSGYLENNQRIIDLLIERHVPYVLLDRYLPDLLANSVVSNNRQGSKELTKLLLGKGHTRILVLAGAECSSMNNRILGYLDALKEVEIMPDESLSLIVRVNDILLQHQEDNQAELERIRNLIKRAGNFTACYFMSNRIFRIALPVLFSKGACFPRTIELVTYDDVAIELPRIADHITIVKQPGYKMGWEAARLLIDTISKPDQSIIQMTLTSEIIEKSIQ